MQETTNTKICPCCGKLDISDRDSCSLDGVELERKWDLNPREQIRLEDKQKRILNLIELSNRNFMKHWRKIERLHSLINKKRKDKVSLRPPALTGFSFLESGGNGFDFTFAVSLKTANDTELVLKGKYLRRPMEEDIFFENLPEENKKNSYELAMIKEIIFYFICDVWLERMVPRQKAV